MIDHVVYSGCAKGGILQNADLARLSGCSIFGLQLRHTKTKNGIQKN